MDFPNILVCDVGNSRIAMAQACGNEVHNSRREGVCCVAELAAAMKELWEGVERPAGIAASSVSPKGLELLEAAAEQLGQGVLLVGRDLPLPIDTDLPEPGRIGTDRLCSAAMAWHRLQSACVVAQLGTAITIDCVNDDGVFLGGAILPGLSMSAEALSRGTACLPKVSLERPTWVHGRDTREAIVGGLVYGARGALRELTEAYATELGKWPPLVLTGGDAELVGQGYEIVHAIVPDLCLMGVSLAYLMGKRVK